MEITENVIRKKAQALHLNYHDTEDAIQESRIAIWLAQQTETYQGLDEDKRRGYLFRTMQRGLLRPLQNRVYGRPYKRGKRVEEKLLSEKALVVEDVNEVFDSIVYDVYPSDTEHIREVVSTLKPLHQEIVNERFWQDKNFSEISEDHNKSINWAHERFTQTIKPKLQEALRNHENRL